jgi:hypothetical protein
MIEGFYMLLQYRNNNRIKKSEMSIGLNLCLVNCTDSLFACIIYVYCSEYIYGSIFVAGRNCEYFLLIKGNTCGLVFSNIVISVLFDYMLIDVWHLICVTYFG